jgi:AcrR family transcriptional regulator
VSATSPLSRALVVDTARQHLARSGADQLSLRGVARDLGVTAPALYAYVKDKRELLAAVATEHFAGLVDRFEAIDAADPLERIRRLSRAYIEHARESPALFRLLFRYPPSPTQGLDAFPPATRAFDVAAAATKAAVDAGLLAVDDPAQASFAMWAAVHGVAEVLLLGLELDDAAADELIDTVIETMLRGQGAAATLR